MRAIGRQKGITLTTVLVWAVIIVVVVACGVKVAPDVIEYYMIMKDAKSVAQDPGMKGASVSEIRNSFSRHAQIDNITSITPQDLDISKEGNEIVLAFAYQKKIPLAGNVSLLIDFDGTTSSNAQ